MSYRNVKTINGRSQIQLKLARRAAKLVNAFQCLIVSSDPARLAMFERAADEAGWKTSLCADAATALVHISRSFMQLAVVDLEGQSAPLFRPVVEQLTGRSGLLLIVCGNEGNLEEEVWIRQSGAWLYLPGVVESSNFTLLCGEARHIAERLSKSNLDERNPSLPLPSRKSYS